MSPSKLYEVSPKTRKLYRLEDLQQASGGVALGPAAEDNYARRKVPRNT